MNKKWCIAAKAKNLMARYPDKRDWIIGWKLARSCFCVAGDLSRGRGGHSREKLKIGSKFSNTFVKKLANLSLEMVKTFAVREICGAGERRTKIGYMVLEGSEVCSRHARESGASGFNLLSQNFALGSAWIDMGNGPLVRRGRRDPVPLRDWPV